MQASRRGVEDETVNTRSCLIALTLGLMSAECLALDVLVNQVGYEPNAPKIVRVQRTADYAGDGTFSVAGSPTTPPSSPAR